MKPMADLSASHRDGCYPTPDQSPKAHHVLTTWTGSQKRGMPGTGPDATWVWTDFDYSQPYTSYMVSSRGEGVPGVGCRGQETLWKARDHWPPETSWKPEPTPSPAVYDRSELVPSMDCWQPLGTLNLGGLSEMSRMGDRVHEAGPPPLCGDTVALKWGELGEINSVGVETKNWPSVSYPSS